MPSLEFIREHWRLDGERLYQVKTGKEVLPRPTLKGYAQTSVKINGKTVSLRVHVVKFALHHGYLPPRVDHRSGDEQDNALGNLRPATHRQNIQNSKLVARARGVRKLAKGWYVYYMLNGRQKTMGPFLTEAGALKAARQVRQMMFKEFHPDAR